MASPGKTPQRPDGFNIGSWMIYADALEAEVVRLERLARNLAWKLACRTFEGTDRSIGEQAEHEYDEATAETATAA